jgi:hypothetical protein
MSKLKDAIEAIASTYGDPLRVAKRSSVDASEVDAALNAATADTVEHYALTLLAQCNPYKPPKATPQTE